MKYFKELPDNQERMCNNEDILKEPTLEEIKGIVQQMRNRRTTGKDGIN